VWEEASEEDGGGVEGKFRRVEGGLAWREESLRAVRGSPRWENEDAEPRRRVITER
jgi:hypothetical protein